MNAWSLADEANHLLVVVPLLQWYNGGMDIDHDTGHKETKLTLRIPAAIAEAMRQLATQHDRSLNGEIVRALREYVARHLKNQEPPL
jgi:hypothetical protein